MRSTRRILMMAAAALALGACASDSTGPASAMDVELTVTNEVRGPAAETILPFTPQVTVKPGAIDVFGQIRTPNPCSTLATSVRESDGTITLVVTAERGASAICAQVITVRDYKASITNVKAGTYTMRVVHEYEELQRDPDVVYEQRITVP